MSVESPGMAFTRGPENSYGFEYVGKLLGNLAASRTCFLTVEREEHAGALLEVMSLRRQGSDGRDLNDDGMLALSGEGILYGEPLPDEEASALAATIGELDQDDLIVVDITGDRRKTQQPLVDFVERRAPDGGSVEVIDAICDVANQPGKPMILIAGIQPWVRVDLIDQTKPAYSGATDEEPAASAASLGILLNEIKVGAIVDRQGYSLKFIKEPLQPEDGPHKVETFPSLISSNRVSFTGIDTPDGKARIGY